MRTVIKMLRDASEKWGNSPYISQKTDGRWKDTSFREAEDEARCFAASLIKHGFKKNNTIAIIAEGRSNWVISEFGLLMAGCISVPLSIKLLSEEIPFRLNHSEAAAVIVSENGFPKLAEIWKLIENKPFIITLADNQKKMKEMAAAAGLSWGSEIAGFEEMAAEGRSAPDEVQEELKARLEAISEDDVVTISYTSGTIFISA